MSDIVMCNVQGEHNPDIPYGTVPEAIARLAYAEYARRGHGDQTFERLHKRGGFGWFELVACLRGEYTNEGCSRARKDIETELAKSKSEKP